MDFEFGKPIPIKAEDFMRQSRYNDLDVFRSERIPNIFSVRAVKEEWSSWPCFESQALLNYSAGRNRCWRAYYICQRRSFHLYQCFRTWILVSWEVWAEYISQLHVSLLFIADVMQLKSDIEFGCGNFLTDGITPDPIETNWVIRKLFRFPFPVSNKAEVGKYGDRQEMRSFSTLLGFQNKQWDLVISWIRHFHFTVRLVEQVFANMLLENIKNEVWNRTLC